MLAATRRGVFHLKMRMLVADNERELQLVHALCPAGGVFVDVGANRGLYTWQALRGGARVIAIEPHPVMAARLIAAFGDAIELHEVALSAEPGAMPLHVPQLDARDLTTRCSLHAGANAGLETRALAVRCVRLDDLDLPPIAMIKVDVEGHELAAMRGARGRLERERPVAMIEVEERHNAGAVAAMFELMTSAGYDGYFYLGGRLTSTTAFELDVHQRAENAPPPKGSPPRGSIYINNFVFLHRQDRAVRDRLRAAGHVMA